MALGSRSSSPSSSAAVKSHANTEVNAIAGDISDEGMLYIVMIGLGA